MTPSVSSQNALIDCAIFAATVFAAVALILGPAWRPPHRATMVMACCSTVPNDKPLRVAAPIAAATRERPDEGGLALSSDGHPFPAPAQRGNDHRYLVSL